MRFFQYESPYRTNQFIQLNTFEFLTPILLLAGLIIILVYLRDTLSTNQRLDRVIRRSFGTVFTVLYLSHYLLRFSIYGLDTIILPFQLCSISMAFAIVLLFTENKTIYTFVLFTGVLGGLISLLTPIIGYDSHYYRYYQFYGAHLLLILTPLYYLIVKQYYPTKKDAVIAFLILQSLAIFMGIFNVIYDTDFMFIFLDPQKINKFPAIQYFGGIPYYIILVEITAILLFIGLYKATNFLQHYRTDESVTYYET